MLIWVVFFFMINDLDAQCSFPNNIPIHDDSVSVNSINISGAVNDDLATNGICGIAITFRHNIIGDVQIKLVSPFGQEVILIGPTAPLSNLTTFTLWDIFFTPCSNSASPDFPFSPIFNNLQLWGQLAQYNGTYYPNDGCLEDFNLGTINGIWQLIVSDVNQFDEGIIESFELFFCDDTGIDCASCDAAAGQIINQDLVACRGDSALGMPIQVIFPRGISDTTEYTNEFVVFNDTSLYEYTVNPNPRFYPTGNYTICNLDVKSSQLTLLPQQGELINAQQYVLELNQSGACADIGDSCFVIQILEPMAYIDVFEEICRGDSIQFFDLVLSDEGSYGVSVGQGSCDTVYVFHLDVVDTNPDIVSDQLGLACVNDSLILTVNTEEMDKNINYLWKTNDGNILSAVNEPSIIIDSVGMYYVETSVGNCVQIDSFQVSYSDTLPVVRLTSDTIDCILLNATITINSSKPLIDRDWTGPRILAEGVLTLEVGLPGVYTLIGTDIDGCQAEISIDVPGNIDPPDITFDVTPISCISDSARLTILGAEADDSIHWLNYNDIESDTFAYITTIGEYYIQSAGINGCERLDTVIIEDASYALLVDVEDDTIDCSDLTPVPDIKINDSVGQVTYLWTFPGGGTSSLSSPVFNEVGLYSLIVEDMNNCTGEAVFNISADTIPPLVMVMDTIFTCIDDSIQIGILNPNPNYSYQWNGPLGYFSTDEEPFIYFAGAYIVQVTDINGCTASEMITVVEGADLPSSSFQINDLDCFSDTASITPLDTVGLLFEYNSPFLLSSTNDPIAFLSNAGLVFLTITERGSGCSNSYEFYVNDLRSYVDVNLFIDTLNCRRDTVVPEVFISDVITDLHWTGPQNFIDTFPLITLPGTYTIEVEGLNGCISSDSIEVIYDRELPLIDVISDTIFCDPDSAYQIANASNAQKYNWYLNNQLISIRDSIVAYEGGRYKVVVEAQNGCLDSIEFDVLQDTIAPEINLIVNASGSCDDSISLISSGPFELNYEYNWSGSNIFSNSGNSIEVVGEGKYFLSITDLNGCSAYDSIIVEDDRLKPSFDIEFNQINCYASGNIVLSNLTNIDQIIWDGPQAISDGTESAEIEISGVYTVSGFSSQGCEYNQIIQIDIDTLNPEILDIIMDTITCKNPKARLGFVTGQPIDSIVLFGSEIQIFDSLALLARPGPYLVTLIGDNGCSIDTAVVIQIDTLSPVSHIQGDTLTCLRSKVLLALDNYDKVSNVHWTGPGVDDEGLDLFINEIGTYTGMIEGFNGCIYTDSIIITEDKDAPIINLQDTFYLPCNGDSIELFLETTDDIVFYKWIGDGFFSESSNPNIADPFEITLFVSGSNGCNTIDSTIVLEDIRAIEFDVKFDSITCIQPVAELIPVRVQDDDSYYWLLPDGSVIENQSTQTNMGGAHKLVVHGGNQCYDSISFIVKVDTISPEANIVYEDTIQCDHRTIELLGSVTSIRSNYIFAWSTVNGNFVGGLNTLNPLIDSEGVYELTVVDTLNGCMSKAVLEVTDMGQSFSDIEFEAFDPFCKGEATGMIRILNLIDPVGMVDIFLNGELINVFQIENLSPGTYELSAVDEFGCEIEKTIEIGDGLTYDVDITGDSIIALGDSTFLEFQLSDPTVLIDSAIWYIADQIICPECDDVSVQLDTNDYVIVQTISQEGCKALDSILIQVSSEIEYQFPTIFSPNDDGINDIFKIPAVEAFDRIQRLLIFDRWGSVVHREENISIPDQQGWNGTLDGRFVVPGVYVVLLDVILKNGRNVKKAFDLTLIR